MAAAKKRKIDKHTPGAFSQTIRIVNYSPYVAYMLGSVESAIVIWQLLELARTEERTEGGNGGVWVEDAEMVRFTGIHMDRLLDVKASLVDRDILRLERCRSTGFVFWHVNKEVLSGVFADTDFTPMTHPRDL